MFGLIKEIQPLKGGRKKYRVCGNNGIQYFYSTYNIHNPQLKQLRINDRVDFDLKSENCNSISELRASSRKNVNGRVVRIMHSKKVIIETTNGEYLEAAVNDTSELTPYQNIVVTPFSPPENSDSFYGHCRIIKIIEPLELTNEIKNKVAELLRAEFGPGSEIPIKRVIQFLVDKNVSPEQFGYYNYDANESDHFKSVLFLEQFTNVLYINPTKKIAKIIGENDFSSNYADAVNSLRDQGYNEPTLLQKRAFSDPQFWDSQKVLIMGNTSSGKTAIPLTRYLLDFEKRSKKPKLLIAVNLRTLTTQMQDTIQTRLQNRHHLSMQISTSEYTDGDNDIKNGDVDIAIVIYEKLFIFSSTIKGFLSKYDHLLLDEAAVVSDPERGAKVDAILSMAIKEPKLKITILGTPLYSWDKYIRSYDFYPICIFSRPVPVHEFFYYPVNRFSPTDQKIKCYQCADYRGKTIASGTAPQSWERTMMNLCLEEYLEDRKTLIFTFSQSLTRTISKKMYSYIKKKLQLPTIPSKEIYEFLRGFLKHYDLSFEELKGYFDSFEEYEALYYGIAFHNASIPEKLRIAIETEFLKTPQHINSGIHILVSTDTLAYGLNSNVDTVIITQMEKYAMNQYQKLSFNTYQNCIGRSGRLGYQKYGTSYTFFTEDFEKKYFNQPVITSEPPQKAINYYAAGSFSQQERISGTLGKIISACDADSLSFFVLSLFSENTVMNTEELYQMIAKIPQERKHDNIKIQNVLNEALTILEEEQFIEYCIENDEINAFDNCDDEGYRLTSKGKCFQGYAIRMQSYKKLVNLIDTLIVGDDFYPIDLFMSLSQIEEFSASFKNMLPTYQKGEEKQQKEARNPYVISEGPTIAEKGVTSTITLINFILPEFQQKNWISDKLYNDIINSSEYINAKKGVHLDDNEFERFNCLRAVIIIGMWISGYNVQLIREIQENDATNIDNIRRKLGEKTSYFVDVIHAIAHIQGRSEQQTKMIHQLSLCLFYGIRFDWIVRRGLPDLSLNLANSFHIASISATRFQYFKSHKIDKISDLKAEFEILDPRIKNIMKEEGVDF